MVSGDFQQWVDHSEDVMTVEWSPEDRWLASCSVDTSVIIWDVPSFSKHRDSFMLYLTQHQTHCGCLKDMMDTSKGLRGTLLESTSLHRSLVGCLSR